MTLLWILIPLFSLYAILMIYYWWYWSRQPIFIPLANAVYSSQVSIIVAARNEEENIGALLDSLQNQTYPREFFEIIVVDDHSTDQTAGIAGNYPGVRLIRLQEGSINSYKKKAIETGIAAARGELIITTDADCRVPPAWLETIVAFAAASNSVFIAGPVVVDADHSILQVFQAMDFMVLQGITGAAVYKKQMTMCNGANLAYQKKVFLEVNGFKGVDHIASGDDMLLMHKIWERYPDRIGYLKSGKAIVSTRPMVNWKQFFNQRIRWASKARQYEDKRIFAVLLLVYLFNLAFPLVLIASFIDNRYWLVLPGLWMVKTLVELPFFISVAKFFERGTMVKWFFLFQPLHIFYTLVAGLFGQFGSYEWKGRKVK